ncbi:MAG: AmmeMemoRadiSam system radical SAM enzyme [Candidatus Hydrogenedentota bacterium]|nr:MAG: AmmeMemoRadiSam system radical SAM enzyme [Candidatus Hydrogenedentota bacterium]
MGRGCLLAGGGGLWIDEAADAAEDVVDRVGSLDLAVHPSLQPVEARHYEKIEGNRVKCHLCPRGCEVGDVERGYCGVRENRGGTYYTLVHSSPCAVHNDPIEKKPFAHVLPGTFSLSIATAGCNVECRFCQNWQISQERPENVPHAHLPPEEVVELARRHGSASIAFTYSEPVIFYEYMYDVARAAFPTGILPVIVSNGYMTKKAWKDLLPHLGAVKVDLKGFTETYYREMCDGELKPVLDGMRLVKAAGKWLEIVTLILPGKNDSEKENRALARWVRTYLGPDVPLHFSRFTPMYRMRNLPPTPVKTLERLHEVARGEGLRFVYIGNVPGHKWESTYCPKCGEVAIRRVGFGIVENRLVNGACPKCGERIPGIWRKEDALGLPNDRHAAQAKAS